MANCASVLVAVLVLYQPCYETSCTLWLSQLIRTNLWQLHLEGCLHSSTEVKHVSQVYLWTVFCGGLAPGATQALTQLLIHSTPAIWGKNKVGEQENSWVKTKTGKPLTRCHCRQNRPHLGNLIVFVVHEHKYLITDSGTGKWTKKWNS